MQGLLATGLVMTETKAAVLQAIIEATHRHIKVLRSLGLDDTAKIFAIAKLELANQAPRYFRRGAGGFREAVDRSAALARPK